MTNFYINVVPPLMACKFDSCQQDFKEVAHLGKDMRAIKSKFFESMETDGAALRIGDLCHPVKGQWEDPDRRSTPQNASSKFQGLVALLSVSVILQGTVADTAPWILPWML